MSDKTRHTPAKRAPAWAPTPGAALPPGDPADLQARVRQALETLQQTVAQANAQPWGPERARLPRPQRIAVVQARLTALRTVHTATVQLLAALDAALDAAVAQIGVHEALAAQGLAAVARDLAAVEQECAALTTEDPPPAAVTASWPSLN